MTELAPHIVRLLEATTEARAKAIALDMEIDADYLRYSNWLSALSTAGLGILITNVDKLGTRLAGSASAVDLAIGAAAALLAVSLVIAGFIAWLLNEDALRCRQRVFLVLKHQAKALCADIDPATSPDLYRQFFDLHFLEKEDRASYKSNRDTALSMGAIRRWLLAQAASLVLGLSAMTARALGWF